MSQIKRNKNLRFSHFVSIYRELKIDKNKLTDDLNIRDGPFFFAAAADNR